jgi:hypothetical protein
LSGGFDKATEYHDLRAALDQMVKDLSVLKKKQHAAQHALSACKDWLDKLPPNTTLEMVEVKTDGRDLEEVRAQLIAAEAELAALRAVPTASADIDERVKAYVREMGRPTISGIGKGEQLRVNWPGSGWDSNGPREHRADILPMMALLHGEAMVAALMREVKRIANDPMPLAARQKRMAKLEADIDTLQRLGLALGAEPNADFPPWVLLGVKIAVHRGAPVATAA